MSSIILKPDTVSHKGIVNQAHQPNLFQNIGNPMIPSSSIKKLKTKFKNSTQEWLVKKKNVSMTEDQQLLDQFNCGYSGNIVVTGKIYITNKRLCFYSPFNDKNVFFQSTFIDIPKDQIMKIQKKHNAKIFDNSIQVTKTNLQTYFFTSFVSRNKCYNLMESNLLKPSDNLSLKKLKQPTEYDQDVQFLKTKVKLEDFEYLVHSFSCGLAIKSNIMGRIFVTNKRIYFHSLFDQNNGFSKETQVNLMKEEILKIEKRYNTLIFDNSILIISKQGSYFFTSFISRDKVFHLLLDVFVNNNEVAPQSQDEEHEVFYDLDESIAEQQFGKGIEKMHQSFRGDFIEHQNKMFPKQDQNFLKEKYILPNNNLKNVKTSSIITYEQQIDDQKVNQSEFMQNVKQNDDINQDETIKRQQQIIGLITHQNKLQQIAQTFLKFPGLNALKTLRIFDSGQQFFINGHKYYDFLDFFKSKIMNRKALTIEKWKPNVLQYLNTSNIKKNCPLQFERSINEVVKLQKTGIPFMPSEAKSKQIQKLFIISRDKYIIESYVHNSGAPYSDTFHIFGRRIVESVSQNTVKITVFMQTVFKKKPILGNLIETKCEQEGTKQQQKMFEAMKEYFRKLQQSKIKR